MKLQSQIRKKTLNQVFSIRKPRHFYQYFHWSRKIWKSGSTKLYDITTLKKIVLFQKN